LILGILTQGDEKGGGFTQQAVFCSQQPFWSPDANPRGRGGVPKTLLAARPHRLPVGQPGPVSAPKPDPQEELPFYVDLKRVFPEAPPVWWGGGGGRVHTSN